MLNGKKAFSGTSIQDTWIKSKWSRDQGLEVGMTGVRGSGGEKMEATVLEQKQEKRKSN